MEKVKITLTADEAKELLELVKNSTDTGNKEWDEKMNSIIKKIESKL